MTLSKLIEIAEGFFDKVAHNEHFLYGLYESLTVKNTRYNTTWQIRDLVIRFSYSLNPPDEEGQAHVRSLGYAIGDRASASLEEIISGYAHPHLDNFGGYDFCMGSTDLAYMAGEIANGHKVTEDRIFELFYLYEQLFQTESEAGGPYYYMRDSVRHSRTIEAAQEVAQKIQSLTERKDEFDFPQGNPFYQGNMITRAKEQMIRTSMARQFASSRSVWIHPAAWKVFLPVLSQCPPTFLGELWAAGQQAGLAPRRALGDTLEQASASRELSPQNMSSQTGRPVKAMMEFQDELTKGGQLEMLRGLLPPPSKVSWLRHNNHHIPVLSYKEHSYTFDTLYRSEPINEPRDFDLPSRSDEGLLGEVRHFLESELFFGSEPMEKTALWKYEPIKLPPQGKEITFQISTQTVKIYGWLYMLPWFILSARMYQLGGETYHQVLKGHLENLPAELTGPEAAPAARRSRPPSSARQSTGQIAIEFSGPPDEIHHPF